MKNPNDIRATELAIAIGGDNVGAAWLIARRKPELSAAQVALAAKRIGERETFGDRRAQRGETAEQCAQRLARRELSRRAPQVTRDVLTALAERDQVERDAAEITELIGVDIACGLSEGETQADIAARLGCSQGTIARRISRAMRA